MTVAANLAALLCVIGMAQAVAGWILARRFVVRPRPGPAARPPITVLKPLRGDEPLLEAALGSVCRQDYPDFQIVFGVQEAGDSAIPVVRRLQSRFSALDLVLVANPARHGANGKVSNLINMLPAARHDVLVIADSDLHCAPDYLDRIAAALGTPGTGLATTLYAGLPAELRLPGLLGATQITHSFLPGALLARALGRQDCLGATMALRRETLNRIGGLEALVERLADTVPLTTVPERSLAELFRHELRWARTIRALVPGQFAASVLQYPIGFAMLATALAAGALWGWALILLAWAVRATAARGIDRALSSLPASAPAAPVPLWLLPLRELMSLAVMIASYGGRRVEWRGQHLQADGPASLAVQTVKDQDGQ